MSIVEMYSKDWAVFPAFGIFELCTVIELVLCGNSFKQKDGKLGTACLINEISNR